VKLKLSFDNLNSNGRKYQEDILEEYIGKEIFITQESSNNFEENPFAVKFKNMIGIAKINQDKETAEVEIINESINNTIFALLENGFKENIFSLSLKGIGRVDKNNVIQNFHLISSGLNINIKEK